MLEKFELQEYRFIQPQEALTQDDIVRKAIASGDTTHVTDDLLHLNTSTRKFIEEFLKQRGEEIS